MRSGRLGGLLLEDRRREEKLYGKDRRARERCAPYRTLLRVLCYPSVLCDPEFVARPFVAAIAVDGIFGLLPFGGSEKSASAGTADAECLVERRSIAFRSPALV